MTALYLQLVGMGMIWVMFHCSGMCGPIMAGLVTAQVRDAPGEVAWQRLARRARAVLAYQSGRALTYGLMGAVLGGAGASLEATTKQVTQIAGLVAALSMMALALGKLWQLRPHAVSKQVGPSASARFGLELGRVVRRLGRRLPTRGPWRMMLYGALLGLMPCMIMFWAMNLAVSSASVLHGAGLMLALVLMTTPTLLGAACLTALKRPAWMRASEYVAPLALLISGAWVGLMAMASNGWIAHRHVMLDLGGQSYMIMFW